MKSKIIIGIIIGILLAGGVLIGVMVYPEPPAEKKIPVIPPLEKYEEALTPEEERDITILELVPVPVKPLTPEERELREFRRFLRGLEEFLAEERITVRNGIYIGADSVFEIRRRGGPTPDLPFAVWFGNAGGYKDLRLRKIDIYSPGNILLHSFSPNKILPSIKEEIGLKIAQEKKLERLLEEARLLLDKEMGEEERERFRKFKKGAKKELGKAMMILVPEMGPPYGPINPVEMREKMRGVRTSLDLTPYLREVGDKATITVRADFTYEAGLITVEAPFNFRLDPPLPDP